jgi:hypothetical protein
MAPQKPKQISDTTGAGQKEVWTQTPPPPPPPPLPPWSRNGECRGCATWARLASTCDRFPTCIDSPAMCYMARGAFPGYALTYATFSRPVGQSGRAQDLVSFKAGGGGGFCSKFHKLQVPSYKSQPTNQPTNQPSSKFQFQVAVGAPLSAVCSKHSCWGLLAQRQSRLLTSSYK